MYLGRRHLASVLDAVSAARKLKFIIRDARRRNAVVKSLLPQTIATEDFTLVGYIAFVRPIPVHTVQEVTMRSLAVASMAVFLLVAAHANETIKFNCEISHIQGFKPDGTALQVSESDMKTKYSIAIQNDAIRAEMKSPSKKELVVYRVLMHNSSDYIGAMAQAKPSDAAIAISKEPNPAYDRYPGGLTASAGGSMKLISLMCAKAP